MPIVALTGPMYSGKTSALIRSTQKWRTKNKLILKPRIDDRYSVSQIVSHTGESIDAKVVDTAGALEKISSFSPRSLGVVAIDEAQFFGPEIVDAVEDMLFRSKAPIMTYVSGLDLDAYNRPWPTMSLFMARADVVMKQMAAKCRCGAQATKTLLLRGSDQPAVGDEPHVEVGGVDKYRPVCLSCFRTGEA